MKQPDRSLVDFYSNKNAWKLTLFLFALGIGVLTLWYTETFVKELRNEEVKRIKLWAEAINLAQTAESGPDLTFATMVIQANTTIPMILTDGEGKVITTRNLNEARSNDPEYLRRQLAEMMEQHEPIEITFDGDQKNYIYYHNSTVLKKLRIYPLLLLVVIAIFVTIAYLAFSSARRSEQNRVWSGMAKETAHQIGTPLSSLMGWVELLKTQGTPEEVTGEMEKDLERLRMITDRFSKIGSLPVKKEENLEPLLERVVGYLRVRSPQRVELSLVLPPQKVSNIPLNGSLIEWVVENLIRNSLDAIEGRGKIEVKLSEHPRYLRIEITDSGKGLTKAQFKTIFRPGYTTKSRGWGLGLSLAKRIVEDYHRGRIFVYRSEPGAGTSIRVQLPKSSA